MIHRFCQEPFATTTTGIIRILHMDCFFHDLVLFFPGRSSRSFSLFHRTFFPYFCISSLFSLRCFALFLFMLSLLISQMPCSTTISRTLAPGLPLEHCISFPFQQTLKKLLDKKKNLCYNPVCWRADIAQLVERLIRNQQVMGPSPIIGLARCSAVW